MKQVRPNIIDVTIKEGGFRLHNHFLIEQIADIVRGLETAGVRYAEISHGRGIGAKRAGYPALYSDKEWLQGARSVAKKMKFCVYLSTHPYSFLEIESLEDCFDLGRVGVNVHEVGLARQLIQRLKFRNKTAIAQLLRVHAHPLKQVIAAAKLLEDEGSDIVYLTDTFGSMKPGEVHEYISGLKDSLKIPVGFQGFNKTGRAIENTLSAIEAGADWVDAALMGMGPGAGVTNLEILVSLLQKDNLRNDLNLVELTQTAKFYVRNIFRTIPTIGLIDLLFAKLKIDYYPDSLILTIASVLDLSPEELLTRLKEIRPNLIQLKEADLKDYLASEGIDFEVLMNFIKTGKVESL